jgi:hypothetical protein
MSPRAAAIADRHANRLQQGEQVVPELPGKCTMQSVRIVASPRRCPLSRATIVQCTAAIATRASRQLTRGTKRGKRLSEICHGGESRETSPEEAPGFYF